MKHELFIISELILIQEKRLAAGPDHYARHAIHGLRNAASAIEMQITYDEIQARKARPPWLGSADKARSLIDVTDLAALEKAVSNG
jgi:hypothetical protein